MASFPADNRFTGGMEYLVADNGKLGSARLPAISIIIYKLN